MLTASIVYDHTNMGERSDKGDRTQASSWAVPAFNGELPEQGPTPEEWQWIVDHRALLTTPFRKSPSFYGIDLMELLTYSLPAILTAMRDWQPERGAAKTSFVVVAIYRSMVRIPRQFSFFGTKRVNGPVMTSNNDMGASSHHPDESPHYEPEEIRAAFRKLKPKHRQILSLLAGTQGHPQTPPQIAERLGIPKSRIWYQRSAAVNALREELGLPPYYQI